MFDRYAELARTVLVKGCLEYIAFSFREPCRHYLRLLWRSSTTHMTDAEAERAFQFWCDRETAAIEAWIDHAGKETAQMLGLSDYIDEAKETVRICRETGELKTISVLFDVKTRRARLRELNGS